MDLMLPNFGRRSLRELLVEVERFLGAMLDHADAYVPAADSAHGPAPAPAGDLGGSRSMPLTHLVTVFHVGTRPPLRRNSRRSQRPPPGSFTSFRTKRSFTRLRACSSASTTPSRTNDFPAAADSLGRFWLPLSAAACFGSLYAGLSSVGSNSS